MAKMAGSISSGGRTFHFYEQTCTRCGKKFNTPIQFPRPHAPLYCRDCTALVMTARRDKFQPISQLQKKLIAEDFSLEQADEIIGRQIKDFLEREKVEFSEKDEEVLQMLTEKLLKDEKRRRKIIKAILRLQKKKK